MNKHIGKLLGLLILTLLVTGCTVFISVDRTGSLRGWIYESMYTEELIISSSSEVPHGYSPLRFRNVKISSPYGGTIYTTVRTDSDGYFSTGNLNVGNVRVTIDYGYPKFSFTTYISRGNFYLEFTPLSVVHYVFVGIDDYLIFNLPNFNVSANDANDMKSVLVDQNDTRLGSYSVLTDESDDLPTKKNIENAINSAAAKASSNDYLVFYFSGYADEEIRYDDRPTDKLDHLVPYDGQDYGSPEEIKESVITDRDLAKWLARFPNDNITVILDVSYAGTFVDGSVSPQSIQTIPEISLQALRNPGYTVLGATNRNARNEIYPGKNSTFTYYLLEGLGGNSNELPADINNDGRVTAQELFNYARDRMKPDLDYPEPIINGDNTNTVIYRTR